MRLFLVVLVVLTLLVAGCSSAPQAAAPTTAPAAATQAAAPATAATAAAQPSAVTQAPAPTAAAKPAVPSAAPAVGKPGESVTITGKGGTPVTISSSTPDELKTFPVPTGFTLEGSSSMTSGGDRIVVGNWKGKATVDAMNAFYQKVFQDQQWTVTLTIADPKGGTTQAQAPNGTVYGITHSLQDDGVMELVVMASKSQATPAAATKAPVAVVTAVATKPAAIPTAEPTPVPQGPATVAITKLPAELKTLPLPNGFNLVQDEYSRRISGTETYAEAYLFGTAEVEAVQTFFEEKMVAAGWEQVDFSTSGDDVQLRYNQVKDGVEMSLRIDIEPFDPGTRVRLIYNSDKVAG